MESPSINHPDEDVSPIFMYSPKMFLADIEQLLNQLKNERFDAILAVARGGLILSSILANRLDIPFIYTIQVKSYDGCKQGCLDIIHEPKWSDLKFLKILIVDDLVDEGKTLECVIELVKKHEISQYQIAVLIDKQKNDRIKPNYYVRVIKSWIAFFWEPEYKGDLLY
jgi:xanthine phosphoribosyltransferase